MNPELTIFETSCRTGAGIPEWADWLAGQARSGAWLNGSGSSCAAPCRAWDSARSSTASPASAICAGWCRNSPQGVLIEVEGERAQLDDFRRALERELPPRAAIHGLEASWLDPRGLGSFAILESDTSGATSAFVMPDIALCEDCRGELLDPRNRRYRYPFTNCTNCGPRFSIIEALPYDRANTSMRAFPMCPECQREYEDPQQPALPRRAQRLSGVRPAHHAVGCGRPHAGRG